jgi:hypothetical protein
VVEFRQAQISLSMNFLASPSPLLPVSEEENVPPYPFPRVLDTLQTRPEILSNSKRDENDGTSRFGWREWRSQPFLHGKLIVVEPFMSVNFLEHQDDLLHIQTVANQAGDIVESLQSVELSEALDAQARCRLVLHLNEPVVVPNSNQAISQQLRSILQKRRLDDVGVEQPLDTTHQKPKGTIYFLGTGSASPSRHRSNSAILVHFDSPSHPETSLLLDAGESCVSQLFHSCQGDCKRMKKILLSLSVVWISHHHADHHCGLSHLLEEMLRCNRTSKVLVIAPATVISYHQYLVCVGGFDHIVEFVPIELTLASHPQSHQHEVSRTNQLIIASTNHHVAQLKDFGLMFINLRVVRISRHSVCEWKLARIFGMNFAI